MPIFTDSIIRFSLFTYLLKREVFVRKFSVKPTWAPLITISLCGVVRLRLSYPLTSTSNAISRVSIKRAQSPAFIAFTISSNLVNSLTLFWGSKQLEMYSTILNFFTFLTVMLFVFTSDNTLFWLPSKEFAVFFNIKGFKIKLFITSWSVIPSI